MKKYIQDSESWWLTRAGSVVPEFLAAAASALALANAAFFSTAAIATSEIGDAQYALSWNFANAPLT